MNQMITAHLSLSSRAHLFLTTSHRSVRAVPAVPYIDGAGAQAADVLYQEYAVCNRSAARHKVRRRNYYNTYTIDYIYAPLDAHFVRRRHKRCLQSHVYMHSQYLDRPLQHLPTCSSWSVDADVLAFNKRLECGSDRLLGILDPTDSRYDWQ